MNHTDYRHLSIPLLVMRDGLRFMPEGSGKFEVAGHARDGEESVKSVSELSPDMVVTDVMMPNKDGWRRAGISWSPRPTPGLPSILRKAEMPPSQRVVLGNMTTGL